MMSRIFATGYLSAVLALAMPLVAQEQAPEAPPPRRASDILSEIRKQGTGAPAALFQEIAVQKDKNALNALCRAVDSLPTGYRASSAALVSFQQFRGLERLEPKAIAYLYERGGRSTGYPSQATAALGGFGEVAHPQLLDLLRKSNAASVRSAALKPLLDMLAAGGSEEGLELMLLNYTGRGICPEERFGELLAQFPEKISLPVFKRTIRDEALRRETRRSTVLAAVALSSPGAIQHLRDCMRRRSPDWLQLAALRALAEIGSTSHGREVTRLLHSPNPVLRFTAICEDARLRQGEPEWERDVLKRVRSRAALERQAAAATLGYLPRSKAFDPLMKLLDDRDHTVRFAALDAIEMLRWYPTLAPLVERMETDDRVMRGEIHRVLVALTGRTWPPAPVMWRKWWAAEGALYKLPTREAAAQAIADFEAERATANVGGTVASFFGVPVISSRVLFIIDVSGSMGAAHVVRGVDYETGMTGTRLTAAKTQLLRALDALPNGDRFNLMFFHTTFELWSDGMAKLSDSSRRSARGFVEEQEPRGGTALYDALERVFLDFDLDIDTVYVLSDGQPGGGTEDRPERIREAVTEWNLLRHITIHSISIGGSIDLLRQLAEDSGGEFREVK